MKQNATLGYNSNMWAEPYLVNVRCVLIVEENKTQFRQVEASEKLCNSRLFGARATIDERVFPARNRNISENPFGQAIWVRKGDVRGRQLTSTAYERDLKEELCTLLLRRWRECQMRVS